MHCPSCQSENLAEAVACSTCGRSLHADETAPSPPRRSSPRAGSRRRRNNHANDSDTANDNDNPAAERAYHLALWALLPGVGLILGPTASLLGWRTVRVCTDSSSRNRAKAAVLLGVLITFTQWLGIALMIYGWRF